MRSTFSAPATASTTFRDGCTMRSCATRGQSAPRTCRRSSARRAAIACFRGRADSISRACCARCPRSCRSAWKFPTPSRCRRWSARAAPWRRQKRCSSNAHCRRRRRPVRPAAHRHGAQGAALQARRGRRSGAGRGFRGAELRALHRDAGQGKARRRDHRHAERAACPGGTGLRRTPHSDAGGETDRRDGGSLAPAGRRRREGARAAARRPSSPPQPADRKGARDRAGRRHRPPRRGGRALAAAEAGRLLRRRVAARVRRRAAAHQPDPRRGRPALHLRRDHRGARHHRQCGARVRGGGLGGRDAALCQWRRRHRDGLGCGAGALELGAGLRREPGVPATAGELLFLYRHRGLPRAAQNGTLALRGQDRLVRAARARAIDGGKSRSPGAPAAAFLPRDPRRGSAALERRRRDAHARRGAGDTRGGTQRQIGAPVKAAVTIWCEVAPDVRDEFDDWHAHEHMPERLSIPGFLRGSRWVGDAGYFMLYEAQSETTITAGAYLERLNNPTPWSRKMMPHHRNMVRGLCRVEASYGAALGQALLTVRFSGNPETARKLARFLSELASRKGLVAAHLLRNIAPVHAAQTTEQKLRGGDAAPDWIALVSGYSAEALASLASKELNLPGSVVGIYRLAY